MGGLILCLASAFPGFFFLAGAAHSWAYVDMASWRMAILRVYVIYLTNYSVIGLGFKQGGLLLFLNNFLSFILYLRFYTASIIGFFFFFELSLLPIFVIILGWGYQGERLGAGLRIFLYTALASLPLFSLIFYCYMFVGADSYFVFLRVFNLGENLTF